MFCHPGTDGVQGTPFVLARGTYYMVLVRGAQKDLMTLSDIMYLAFKEHGIPQVALENHVLEQVKKHDQVA